MVKIKSCGWALILIAAFAPSAVAQQWLSQLPQSQRGQPTINDLRQAFDHYYREHPVDLTRDKLSPTFRFEGVQEERDRVDVEAYKMFRRWEWLVEPRAYPSGQLDLAQIAIFRSQVKEIDDALVAKQAPPTPPGSPPAPMPKPLAATLWKPLGPSDAIGGTNMGRVTCIEFDPSDVKIMYLCGADGGVWKSTTGGTAWTTKFDFEPTLSVGDVAIDRLNPNTIYVATSDPFGYGVPFWGGTYSVGVLKSTDGGNTWTPTGLKWPVSQNRVIRRLVIHPSDPKILLAATSAGLFRTADSGATWQQILPTSTYDVEFQDNNGAIAYVTTNRIMKSTDAGASFSPLSATCTGTRYNIKIAPSNPDVLYSLCADAHATVQKSINAGTSWSVLPASGVTLYGYYDTVLAVSPIDEKTVYVAGFDMKRSTDGGTTWSSVPVAGHPDNHVLKFAPGSSTTLYSGNDGGIFQSTNAGATWASRNKGLAITQFYRLGVSKSNANIMVAGAQDNGNIKYTAGTFTNMTNADGMQSFVDWSNSNVIYAEIQYGSLYRSTNGGTSFTAINTPAAGDWLSPWCQDPVKANTLYAATNKVYKSANEGTNWTPISGTLSGIPTFTVLKVAPSNTNVIYAGNGTNLYRTINGGGSLD